MNINLGKGDNTLQNPLLNMQTDSASGKMDSQQIVTGNTADIRNLMPGQMFEGNVADINGTLAKIILGDNTVLNATLQEDVNINIGDNVTFVVKDNTGGKIVLKPVMESGINDKFIDKVLNATGISVSSSHKEVVNELMKQGQPVDRQTILDVIRANVKYPDMPVSDIVTMNKSGIPFTDENVEMYSAFIKNEGKISEYIKNVVDDIPDMILNSFENAGKEETINFVEKLFNIFTDNDSEMADVIPEVADGTTNDETFHVPSDNYGTATENTDNKTDTNVNLNTDANANISENESITFNKPDEQVQIKEKEQLPVKEETAADTGKTEQVKESVNDNPVKMSEKNESFDGLKENATEELKETAQKLADAAQNDTGYEKFSELKDKLFNLIKKLPDKEAEKFIKSDEFLKVVKDTVKGRFFLKPDRIVMSDDSKKYIKDVLVKINRQMEELSDIVKNSVSKNEIDEKNAKTILNDIKNTGGNMNFMNEFNNHVASYIQIPVKFSNEETAGELYIYNKNKKVTAEDGITAFLHFDLENLGATDIRIKLKGKGIKLSFELDDKISAGLVDEHFGQLQEKLEKKGYNVNYTVSEKKRESESVLKDILDNGESGKIKRYTFDIRT